MATPRASTSGLVSLCRLEVAFEAQAKAGQGLVRQAAHVGAGRLVAEHQVVRLGAVQEAEADPGEGGVEERALPFHEVPVVSIIGGAEPFDGTRDEVGDDRVDRDALARNQDAGLAGGAEIGLHAARLHLLFQRQGRVHLAAGAVGANGEDALARALRALAGGEGLGRMADIEQASTMALGRLPDRGAVGEAHVQAGGHVHAGLDAGNDCGGPVLRQDPARIGDPDQ
jgi:hypothetical protein